MVSKKELTRSVVVRRAVYNRLYGLGFVAGWEKRTGNLPRVDKEGFGTGEHDNGGLFVRSEFDFRYGSSKGMQLTPYKEEKPTKEQLELIVDEALGREKATLLGSKGYDYEVLFSNDFFPTVARQIVTVLNIDGKLDITVPEGTNLSEKHIATSYLPPSSTDEVVRYSCRTEIASYLAVCLTYWEHYHTLATPQLRFLGSDEFLSNLTQAREPVMDETGRTLLIPTYIVHCHNSRLLKRSRAAPISILGYGSRFGEFSLITFEEAGMVLDELRSMGKKTDGISPKDAIVVDDQSYFCVVRFYPGTTPGRRAPRRNIMVVSPTKDLKFQHSRISEAVSVGYNAGYATQTDAPQEVGSK